MVFKNVNDRDVTTIFFKLFYATPKPPIFFV